MPRSSDDDAPRWELPVWEPPVGTPSDDVPRWEPERAVPRWRPQQGPKTRAHVEARNGSPATPSRGVPPPKASAVTRPLAWWGSHPWIVVWALVLLAPVA